MKRVTRCASLVGLLFMMIFCLIAFSGCGSGAATGETDAGTSSGQEPETTTVPRNAASIKAMQDDMSRIRGLPVKSDITVKYLSRDQMKGELEEEMKKSMPPKETETDEKVLRALGLLKPGENLGELVSIMLGEEIAGYYDIETSDLAIISESAGMNVMDEITLSHEMTHALQDQSFDLQRLVPTEGTGNSDVDLARMALVEGDASLAMTEYMQSTLSPMEALSLGLGSLGETSGMTDMPAFLESQLTFPYLEGEAFVTSIKGDGGWERVNAAYQKPPESTEQVMHPEKYLTGEQPVVVTVPDLTGIIGADWLPEDEDALGEFDVRTILSENLSASQASKAAAGWGGGRYRYYQRTDGSVLLAILLVWDSPGDADEFSSAMGTCLEKRYGDKFVFASGKAPLLATVDGTWSVEQHGNSVAVVLSPDAAQAAQVADLFLGL